MDRKAFFKLLFLLFMLVPVLTGWQVVTAEAETQTAAVSPKSEAMADPGSLNVILLNNQGYKKKRKGPVEFTHKKHVYEYKAFCWNCHHDYKDGKNVWVPWGTTKRCDQCHNPATKEHNKIMLQKAFHYQCKGCHAELAKKVMETGPYKKCGGCHQKEEPQK